MKRLQQVLALQYELKQLTPSDADPLLGLRVQEGNKL